MIIFFVTTGVIYNVLQVKATQSDRKDIIIETEVKELYTKETQLSVRIMANNTKLLNEHTFLSYHIYNKSGEVVLYENERIPINIDKNSEQLMTVLINLNSIPNKVLKNGLIIEFDIVDEKKAYWFSLDKSINIDTEAIVFEDNYLKRVYFELIKEALENKIVFFINLLFLFITIVGVILVRKKYIFES